MEDFVFTLTKPIVVLLLLAHGSHRGMGRLAAV